MLACVLRKHVTHFCENVSVFVQSFYCEIFSQIFGLTHLASAVKSSPPTCLCSTFPDTTFQYLSSLDEIFRLDLR